MSSELQRRQSALDAVRATNKQARLSSNFAIVVGHCALNNDTSIKCRLPADDRRTNESSQDSLRCAARVRLEFRCCCCHRGRLRQFDEMSADTVVVVSARPSVRMYDDDRWGALGTMSSERKAAAMVAAARVRISCDDRPKG